MDEGRSMKVCGNADGRELQVIGGEINGVVTDPEGWTSVSMSVRGGSLRAVYGHLWVFIGRDKVETKRATSVMTLCCRS